jgi:MFS family permease
VLPLLGILPVHQGGLGLNAAAVGGIFTSFAIGTIIGDFAYPWIARRFKYKGICNYGLVVAGIGYIISAALPAVDWRGNVGLIVAAYALVSLPRVIAVTSTFSAVMMGISACAPRRHLGLATGISHSLCNVVRAILPSLLTYIFALSVGSSDTDDIQYADTPSNSSSTGNATRTTDGPPQSLLGPAFPFNRWLVFLMLAGLIFSAAAWSRTFREENFLRSEPAPVGTSGEAAEDVGIVAAGDREEDDEGTDGTELRPVATTQPSGEVALVPDASTSSTADGAPQ